MLPHIQVEFTPSISKLLRIRHDPLLRRQCPAAADAPSAPRAALYSREILSYSLGCQLSFADPSPSVPSALCCDHEGKIKPGAAPPYTLLSSPSCRSSRSVVPGRLGHRALHCRLQTHGKLPLLRIPRHDGHCFHLDNGLFLRRSPTLRLVQVGARVLSTTPAAQQTPQGQETRLGLRPDTGLQVRGNGAVRTETGPQPSVPPRLGVP